MIPENEINEAFIEREAEASLQLFMQTVEQQLDNKSKGNHVDFYAIEESLVNFKKKYRKVNNSFWRGYHFGKENERTMR